MPEPGSNREIRKSAGVSRWEARYPYSTEWTPISINLMSKMELCKACGINFPKASYPGRVWPHYTTVEMIEALVKNVCPPAKEVKIKDENAPATDKQKQYIRKLSIRIPFNERLTFSQIDRLTMGEASSEIKRLQEWERPKSEPEPEPLPKPEPMPKAEWTGTSDLGADPELERRVSNLETSQNVQNDVIVRHEERISAVASLINDLRPQITEIHFPERPIITIEGRQHKQFDVLVRLLGEGLNVFLVGPPGTGKSHMVEQAAIALGLTYGSESCDPSMMASTLFGFRDANGNLNRTPYMDAFDKGGLFSLEEMDKCHPGILSKVNTGVANKVCAFPDGMHRAHADWRIVGNANTWGNGAVKGHESALTLDKATKNRFVKLFVGYDEALETEMALTQYDHPDTHRWLAKVRSYRQAAETLGINEYFTPRNSVDGAKCLRGGFTFEETTELALTNGLSDEVARKLAECAR